MLVHVYILTGNDIIKHKHILQIDREHTLKVTHALSFSGNIFVVFLKILLFMVRFRSGSVISSNKTYLKERFFCYYPPGKKSIHGQYKTLIMSVKRPCTCCTAGLVDKL